MDGQVIGIVGRPDEEVVARFLFNIIINLQSGTHTYCAEKIF